MSMGEDGRGPSAARHVFDSKQGLGCSGNSCASNATHPDEHASDSRGVTCSTQWNTHESCRAKRHHIHSSFAGSNFRGTAEATRRQREQIGVASTESDVRVIRHHSGHLMPGCCSRAMARLVRWFNNSTTYSCTRCLRAASCIHFFLPTHNYK